MTGPPPAGGGAPEAPDLWLAPDAFAPPAAGFRQPGPGSGPPAPRGGENAERRPATGGRRGDHWLVALAAVATCLALLVFTGGLDYARATPRYEQAPPGMAYARDGATVRVLSIVAAPAIRTGSGKQDSAPRGSVYVVARLEVTGRSDSYLCTGRLVLSDGRAFREAVVSKPEAATCSQLGKQPVVQFGLYFLVPERSAGLIAGIAVEQRIALARTTVLRPA